MFYNREKVTQISKIHRMIPILQKKKMLKTGMSKYVFLFCVREKLCRIPTKPLAVATLGE